MKIIEYLGFFNGKVLFFLLNFMVTPPIPPPKKNKNKQPLPIPTPYKKVAKNSPKTK